jgi:peptidoglycan/xylan/chitin deacetylase (PgdA/CDA1 family)
MNKAMAARGHEIASHTLTHLSLAGDKVKAEKEMAESKRIIEEKLGDSCLTISKK